MIKLHFLFLFLIVYYFAHYIVRKYIHNYWGYLFLCSFLIISNYFLFFTTIFHTLIFSCTFFILLFKKNISLIEKFSFSVLIIIVSIFLSMDLPSSFDIFLLLLQGFITLLLTSHNKKQKVSRTIMIIGLSIASFVLLHIGIYFRMGLLNVITMILPGIGYAVTPLFELIPTRTSNKIVQVWQDTYGNKSQLKEGIVSSSNSNHSSQLPDTLIGITILLLMSYAVYRILKRKNSLKINESNILPAVFMLSRDTNATKNKKVKAPENSFRFIIFRLEQQLQHPFSRNRGETLEDWLFRLKRLGISMNEMLIIQSSNEARYSQNKLDSHLLTSLKKEVEHVIYQQKKWRNNLNPKEHRN
ncbi:MULTISPECIES: DUF4018 domain-containing protein [unclassified Bacillus (in: firmicutes)]|uniref:DUF4018 domain-containing protein n=2 Tax=unclassified Bacillus (in: firmicutes) TaxID=185979 RepID=UPI001FCD3DB0|nr:MULTISPECIES: DUF4018 domain-containing protein [unclassified Bacillus (in: firmicutes)]